MRMNFKKSSLRRAFGAAASAVLLSGLAASAQPFSDPTGTWDCTMSGGRNGLAIVTFSGNTFSIFEILVPKKQEFEFDATRGTENSTRQGDIGGGTNLVSTQLFGAGAFAGTWNYDQKGHVIGHFIESSAPVSCTTNLTFTTTYETNGGIVTTITTTNISIDCTGAV